MCYASISNGRLKRELSPEQIYFFVEKFLERKKDLKKFEITWCGTGEVFMHKNFTEILNVLNDKYSKNLSHRIITNGTIDRLNEIKDLTNIKFEVSIDGLEEQNDWNRGIGSYRKSIEFSKKANKYGCKGIKIRSILTRDNFNSILEFERVLKREIGENVGLSFQIPCTNDIVRKLHNSAVIAKVDDSKIMNSEELKQRVKSADIDTKKLICYDDVSIQLYLSLNQNGVFCCCEGEVKLGDLNTNMDTLLKNLHNSIEGCKKCPLFDNYCTFKI
jgi:hypothetical protein